MVVHFTPRFRAAGASQRRLLIAVALTFFVIAFAPVEPHASAKAPPLATTILDASALAAPDYSADQLALIPQGAEIELTGDAAPGFLAVYYDGQVVWVPAQYLSLGSRPGIDTAVTIEDTPLLEAPMHDASVIETILAGESVILTGANVDGYNAASHEGAGGWVLERALTR